VAIAPIYSTARVNFAVMFLPVNQQDKAKLLTQAEAAKILNVAPRTLENFGGETNRTGLSDHR
jgi:hypothetical protein